MEPHLTDPMDRGVEDRLRTLAKVLTGRHSPGEVDAHDWPEIVAAAMDHDVGPLLWWTLNRAQIDPPQIDLRDSLWEPLRRAEMLAGTRQIAFETELLDITAVLTAAGIPFVWLKGLSLAFDLYPRPDLRPMQDLDLLVPEKRRKEALQRVQAQGYDFYRPDGYLYDGSDPRALEITHHYQLMGGQTGRVVLEIHFRLFSDRRIDPAGDHLNWCWSQIDTALARGKPVPVLRPEANLLYLAAHMVYQHGMADFSLRRCLDLHLLIKKGGIEWPLVVQQAARFHWSYAVGWALETAVAFFDSPVPGKVLQMLTHAPNIDQDVARVLGLSGSGARVEKMMGAFSALSWPQRIPLLIHLAFPPRAYVQSLSAEKNQHPVWMCYCGLWRAQIADIIAWLKQRRS